MSPNQQSGLDLNATDGGLGSNNAVLNQWYGRLKSDPYADLVNQHPFLQGLREGIEKKLKEDHRRGSRTGLPKAAEMGLAEAVRNALEIEQDSEVYTWKDESGGQRQRAKRADISFTLNGHPKCHLVFEVKTALEFNSLAAAWVEALLFKSGAGGKNVTFVLFSIAGKDWCVADADRWSKTLDQAAGKQSPTIDRIFVLSKEAGSRTPNAAQIVHELGESLSAFEGFLVDLREQCTDRAKGN